MKRLLLTFLPLLSLQAAEHKAAFIMSVLAPQECGEIKLNRYENKFSLSIDDDEQDIPNYMVSKPLRQMKPEQLAGFLQSNYLTLKQCSDGEFSLEEHGRLHGGGPGGGIAGWLGGYVAGEVAGKVVIMGAGYIALYGTKFVIGRVGGPEAEAAFGEKMQTQMIPHLHEASEKIAHVTGGGGAILGGIFGTASPTP